MSQEPKILVVGGDSTIGNALAETLQQRGEFVWRTSRRASSLGPHVQFLDLDEESAKWRLPDAVDIAYLCTGVTSLKNCREDRENSRRTNVDQTLTLARMLIDRHAFVVFLSTNLVFDGSVAFRNPDDATCPCTEYGRQKAAVEKALMGYGNRVGIVRLSKVVPPDFSLIRQWSDALCQDRPVNPFSDMVMSPVTLLVAVSVVIAVGEARYAGITQYSADSDVTYHEVTQRLARRLGADDRLVQPRRAADSGETIEHAPSHTTLDSERARRDLGISPPSVWVTVDWLFERLGTP